MQKDNEIRTLRAQHKQKEMIAHFAAIQQGVC